MLNGIEILYSFEIKKVKNVNLRIRPDGSICVSAPKNVPRKVIDSFLVSKADFIISALEKYAKAERSDLVAFFTEDEVRELVLKLCKKVYPNFKSRSVNFPEIKFRRMISRWGSCHSVKGILTFNLNLKYASEACIEYVVLHEFTHFLQPNHSKRFYDELSKVCPDWKLRRNELKKINLRRSGR